MSDQPGKGGVPAQPRSRPTPLALLVVVGLVVVVVVVALISRGGSPVKTPSGLSASAPPFGVPSLAAGAQGIPASGGPLIATSSSPSPTIPPPAGLGLPPGETLSGVAGVGTAAAAQFGAWRGKPVDVVVDYVGTQTWDGVTDLRQEGLLDRGLPASIHRVFSVPLIPSGDNATLAQGATGAYDQYFQALAEQLIQGGQSNATIRLGWEMTGDWFAWSGVAHPQQWVGAYQHAVTAMRSVPGAQFTFDWTVALGNADPEPMYPGDAYVDLIGADNYDASYASGYAPTDHVQVWNGILTEAWGLNWLADFASKHDKRISIGEWGVTQRADGHGGGDDPYFVEQMHSWITSHDVAYEAYFNSTDPSVQATFALDAGAFPQAGERYKQLFGGTTGTTVGAASGLVSAPASTVSSIPAQGSAPVTPPVTTAPASGPALLPTAGT